MFRILDQLVDIYRDVKVAWPRRLSAQDGSGDEKLGAVRTADQRRVVDNARERIAALVETEISRIPGAKTKKAIHILLVDGVYLRKHNSEVHVATNLLEKVLPAAASTLQNIRSMSRLEVTLAQERTSLMAPDEVWRDYEDPDHARDRVKRTALSAGAFARELVIRHAGRLDGAPPDLIQDFLRRGTSRPRPR